MRNEEGGRRIILPLSAFLLPRWQSERHVRATRLRVVLAPAARDHDVLPAVHHIQRRRRVTREGERGFPEELAGAFVEDAELLVIRGRADEEQAVPGHD